MGTQQSGLLDLKIANLAKDGQIVVLARDVAKGILNNDSNIEKEENKAIRTKLDELLKSRPNWGKIA